MAYSITIKNQDGVVQLDPNAPNMVVIEKGTYPNNTLISREIDFNAMIFIRPSIVGAELSCYENSSTAQNDPGNKFKLSVTSGLIEFVKIKHCGLVTPQATGYGLRIFNPSGNSLLFSSEFSPVRMIASIASNATPSAPINLSLQPNFGASTAKYIFAPSLAFCRSTWNNINDAMYATKYIRNNADDSSISLLSKNIAIFDYSSIVPAYFYDTGNFNYPKNYAIIEC